MTQPEPKGSLVLSRKPGESFFIGDNVEVRVVSADFRRNEVKLQIVAPKSVVILRSELKGKPK